MSQFEVSVSERLTFADNVEKLSLFHATVTGENLNFSSCAQFGSLTQDQLMVCRFGCRKVLSAAEWHRNQETHLSDAQMITRDMLFKTAIIEQRILCCRKLSHYIKIALSPNNEGIISQ
jgi:hypothetical protein